jgi:hypothetical protein
MPVTLGLAGVNAARRRRDGLQRLRIGTLTPCLRVEDAQQRTCGNSRERAKKSPKKAIYLM